MARVLATTRVRSGSSSGRWICTTKLSAVVNSVLPRPSQVLVMRATSLPAWSSHAEVPRPPVLGVDRAVGVAVGLEAEADLADHVLLHDLADLGAAAVLDDDLRLHHLGRAGEGQEHVALHVDDLQLVGEELVDAAEHAQRLLGRRLAHLADRADLRAVLVVDRVLVVDLDDLGLLVHHQHRLGRRSCRRRSRRWRRRRWRRRARPSRSARFTVGTWPAPAGGSTDCLPCDDTCSVHCAPSQ